jgi:uncharacterized protein YndB with AHSA1/START domain
MKPAQVSTPSDTEVLVQRSFDAPAELVWQAYTQPDLMRRWLQGPSGWTMSVCEMDPRVGGAYRWRWRTDDGAQEFGFTGEFREVTPHSMLVHTQIYDPGSLGIPMGDGGSLVTVAFSEAGGVTHAATTIRFASKADRDEAMSTGMTEGMEMSYQALDEVLAGQGA